MAAYNPLSYLPFGKKKDTEAPDVEENTASADAVENREGGIRAVSPVTPAGPGGGNSAASAAADRAEYTEHGAQGSQPLLRVIKGQPTDEELAALTVVVCALRERTTAGQNPILATASRLLNRRQWLGASLKPGPGSWRRARPM